MEYRLIIDRFEDDKVVLKMEDKETIIWPDDGLSDIYKEGDVLRFSIFSDKEAKQKKQTEAKDILNEILDIDK